LNSLKIKGKVINPGLFSGKLVFVRNINDLSRLDNNSIAVLINCGKSISMNAIDKSKCAINTQMALTAHLSLNLKDKPYAISADVKNLKENSYYEISIENVNKIYSEMVNYIKPITNNDLTENGGKGSKLLLLNKINKFNIPNFQIITISYILKNINSPLVKKILNKNYNEDDLINDYIFEELKSIMYSIDFELNFCLDKSKTYAVRSSGVDEDSVDNPMAGYFDSFLNVSYNNIKLNIKKVILSAFNNELIGRKIIDLYNYPKIAVVIQEMVLKPLYSGTFFTHISNSEPYPIVEAVYKNYGEKLMNSDSGADIAYSIEISNNTINKLTPIYFSNIIDKNPHDLFLNISSEALEIYKNTGYGDCEFVVNDEYKIHWVQARPLGHNIAKYEIAELVNRTGYSDMAIQYYKKLAPTVSKVHFLKDFNINCFTLEKGIFGYCKKIRNRDKVFHNLIKENISYLIKVKDYGWEIERKIEVKIKQKNVKLNELFDLLIIHGAIQLPFSIPTLALKDRFNSFAVDSEKENTYFDTLADNWISISKIELFNSGVEMIDFLRKPIENNWMYMQIKEMNKIKNKSISNITYFDLIEIALFELRDLPLINDYYFNSIIDEKNDKNINNIYLIELAKKIRNHDLKPNLSNELIQQKRLRNKISNLMNDTLPPKEKRTYKIVEEYLLMKGEINETHSYYRGKVFSMVAHYFYRNKFNIKNSTLPVAS